LTKAEALAHAWRLYGVCPNKSDDLSTRILSVATLIAYSITHIYW
jgi:hypothetical protein